MSRYFAIQSWVSSHDNEPDYSGQQTGSRHVRSVEIPMFTQHGRANVDWFSDEQIALRSAANKPKLSIKDKILPQFKRLQTLRSQMADLENEYKTTGMSIEEYSTLRDIIVCKIERQEVLYRKAVSVKPNRPESYNDLPQDKVKTTYSRHVTNEDICVYPFEESGVCGVDFIDELSDTNSLKNILKKACKVIRTVRYYSQQAAAYYRTLKEV